MEHIRKLMARVDALNLRERVLIALTMLCLMLVFWDQLLMQPLNAERARLSKEVDKTRQEIVALHSHVETIVAAHAIDPDGENRLLAARLREEIERNKGELRESTAHLIAPDDMAQVLETVLQKIVGLTFVRFEGLGVESVFDGALKLVDSSGQTTASMELDLPTAYKHGLRIEFEGGYLDTLRYLRELEALPWAFLWGSVVIKVEEYPNSAASVTVYTLSLDKNWIGV